MLQVIKLSDAVQALPRSVTEFVHGVPGSYLAIGQQTAQPQAPNSAAADAGELELRNSCSALQSVGAVC